MTFDLYLFADGKDVVLGWHSFDAEGESEALELAEGLVHQPPAELWQGSALVKRWERD